MEEGAIDWGGEVTGGVRRGTEAAAMGNGEAGAGVPPGLIGWAAG